MSVDTIEVRPIEETGVFGGEEPQEDTGTEEQQQQQQVVQVDRRRWLVLSAMVFMILGVGIHRCLGPIIDIVDKSVGISLDNYNFLTQVSLYIIVVTVLGMAQMLERFGIRKTVSLP